MSIKNKKFKKQPIYICDKTVCLIAPEEYQTLDENSKNKIIGGCGPGSIGDFFVPDKILGIQVTEACKIHDYMQYISTSFEDKKISDKVFCTNLLLITEELSKNKLIKFLRQTLSILYYNAVKYFGVPFFVKEHLEDVF